ncbi:hypothetical protein B296_00046567 [Ensete ventricosum]|uniref:ArsA/GET3 Anion-transporting ATPase-like domain-containing protein n=1 Tax=Ensete ventricosum TaxID=4639 RepID=A0A426YWS5_ENSVE|nr:hypothetical protein B296_00046567 [Ensete ventricosum]
MEGLPLAYNISFDAWVIDVGATSLGAISVSCAPPSRSVSPGRSRPLLPRCWRSVRRSLRRHWLGRCKPCGGASWMATVDEEPPRSRLGRGVPASGAGCYSQMRCQDRDEKLEEAISYCKRTMAGDETSKVSLSVFTFSAAAASSPLLLPGVVTMLVSPAPHLVRSLSSAASRLLPPSPAASLAVSRVQPFLFVRRSLRGFTAGDVAEFEEMASGTKRKYYMLGGKGGVGKTSCAASLAVKFANHGHPTIVVSTDPAHSLSDSFAQVYKSYFFLQINPEKAREEFRSASQKSGGTGVKDFMDSMGLGMLVEQLGELKLGELLDTPPPGLDEAIAISKV